MLFFKWLLIAPVAIPGLVDCANILAIFQFPFFSHQQLQHILLRELASRGHNLTIFTTYKFDYDNFPNVVQHHFNESVEIHKRNVDVIKFKEDNVGWYKKIIEHEQKAFFEIALSEFAHPEMHKIIHEKEKYRFDLIIGECIMCSFTLLSDIYDCPVVFFSAVDAPNVLHGLMGNDVNPAQHPDLLLQPFLHRHLTFVERLESLLVFLFYASFFTYDHNKRTRTLQEMHFPGLSEDLKEVLYRRAALMLTNTNPAFGHTRPLMPNTVQVGFMHVEPAKKIKDEKLMKFLDDSKNGVVIMNFGSFVDSESLDQATVKKFLNVFNCVHFDVIWKWRESELQMPENVLLLNWMPLADVLAHPSVKLIIFHGGIFTAYEAIDREVPMIVFPLAYDQGANARMLVHNEVALEFDINDFSESELLTAIDEMTKERYRENVRLLRERAFDMPIPPRALALWHIERLLRTKQNLRVLTSGYTEQFQRFYLDMLAIGFVLIIVSKWLTKKLINAIFGTSF